MRMIAQSKFTVTTGRLVVWVAVLVLVACEADAPIPITDYTTRLARVLDVPVAETEIRPLPRLPRVRELRQSLSEDNIDLLEFLRLSGCELQSLIAERNSSLGKLAQPSQRLVYELNFLRAGSACVDTISAEYGELAQRLNQVLQIKKHELPVRVWDALLGGREFRSFWARTGDDTLMDSRSIVALAALQNDVRRWMSGDYQVDSVTLESSLEAVALGGGGNLIYTWHRLTQDINQATGVLESRLGTRPLCFQDMRNPQSDVFQRVVNQFFMANIQKDVAALNRVTFALFEEVHALERLLGSAEPIAYAGWRRERDTLVERGRQAMRDHVAAIEPLFLQCGFIPGGKQ